MLCNDRPFICSILEKIEHPSFLKKGLGFYFVFDRGNPIKVTIHLGHFFKQDVFPH